MKVIEPSARFDLHELKVDKNWRPCGYAALSVGEKFTWTKDWGEDGAYLLSLLENKDSEIGEVMRLIRVGHNNETVATKSGFSKKTIAKIRGLIRGARPRLNWGPPRTAFSFSSVVRSEDYWLENIRHAGIGQRGSRIYNEMQVRVLGEQLRAGESIESIHRSSGADQKFLRRIKGALIGPILGCECGRVAGHRGLCKIRLERTGALKKVFSHLLSENKRRGRTTRERITLLINESTNGLPTHAIASRLGLSRSWISHLITKMSDKIERGERRVTGERFHCIRQEEA